MDIGDSDLSAQMRILVRIVTFHVYECRHDVHVYSDIQIIHVFLRILETLIEVRRCAYWSGSSLSMCMSS